MKWIILASTFIILSACSCCGKRSVEYSQVYYGPAVTGTTVVGAVVPTPVPVFYNPVVIDAPVDVTTTTVDYY